MLAPVLLAGSDHHGQRGLDRHVVGVRRAPHDLIGDVDVGLAHVVMGSHAAAVQAHRWQLLLVQPPKMGAAVSRSRQAMS